MSTSPTLGDMQAAGFPMGAEPLVALDLADTLILVTDPVTDLIASAEQHERWWQLQAGRLPSGPAPAAGATRRLRAALRSLFDADLAGRAPDPAMIEDLNATAASVPTSPRLEGWGDRAHTGTRWHTEAAGDPALAAIAGEAVRLLGDPRRRALLRRCANPECSMLFLAENKRRVWCTANLCGNRARVARHYETHRGLPPSP